MRTDVERSPVESLSGLTDWLLFVIDSSIYDTRQFDQFT